MTLEIQVLLGKESLPFQKEATNDHKILKTKST